VYPVSDSINFVAFELVVDSKCEKSITGFILEFHHTFLGVAGDLSGEDTFRIDDLLHENTIFGREVFETCDVNFIDDKHDRFATKEGLDGVEKITLHWC